MSERDGGLDDLFSSAAEPVPDLPEVRRPRSRTAWIVRNVLLVVAATVVTVAALRSAGISVSLLLIVAAFVALRLLMLAVSQVAAPAPPRATSRPADSEHLSQGGDALRAAVRRWELRLDWAQSDADQYSRNVLPVIAELTDERLRLRHGITRASDPRRARELLGEALWQTLAEPGRRPPKGRDLAAYVETLERL
ncbi:hypothetical protein EV385_3960 [Krasilnikovia cinnamomea]|uniref:Uncharacterized protein n=1 Tax=Krasilnikovia cinnamomea TaxID=349313 RepID=A0A4Q7ZP80_9ACTN|nr:hypothetical protein [Krasilnikovia cinnamomea]RZU52119.1 hypothetical protein EV385_3960 [Krasilnikovia cinnamomea]